MQNSRSSLRSAAKKPVPHSLYQHPDPILRRLRLRKHLNKQVDLRAEFRDTVTVAFLFGSDWARGAVRDFYKDVAEFCMRHPHRFKCIYVSIDTSEEAYKINTRNQPWLACEWADGSNLPVADYEDADDSVIGSLAGAEDFLLANEADLEASIVADDPEGTQYVRPYSRVHLAKLFGVEYVPTLVVYSLVTRKVLSRRVKPEMIRKERQDATWVKWEAGEASEPGWVEFFIAMRWTLVLVMVALIYQLFVRVTRQNPFADLLMVLFPAR